MKIILELTVDDAATPADVSVAFGYAARQATEMLDGRAVRSLGSHRPEDIFLMPGAVLAVTGGKGMLQSAVLKRSTLREDQLSRGPDLLRESPHERDMRVIAEELRKAMSKRKSDEIAEARARREAQPVTFCDAPEYADFMEVSQWDELVAAGCFEPSDGCGTLAKMEGNRKVESNLSCWTTPRPDWATHVAWYNK